MNIKKGQEGRRKEERENDSETRKQREVPNSRNVDERYSEQRGKQTVRHSAKIDCGTDSESVSPSGFTTKALGTRMDVRVPSSLSAAADVWPSSDVWGKSVTRAETRESARGSVRGRRGVEGGGKHEGERKLCTGCEVDFEN